MVKIKPADITNSDKQILLDIYNKDPFMVAQKIQANQDTTFDYSYISGIFFMFSVMGLIIYANFHYDIKLSLIKSCIKLSQFKICCIIPWLFEFATPPPKQQQSATHSKKKSSIKLSVDSNNKQIHYDDLKDMYEFVDLTVTEDCNISYPIERTNYQKNILIV
jgi:hypothetical protein